MLLRRRRSTLSGCVAAIGLVVICLFARSFWFEFTNWDDDLLIWKNPFVTPPTWAAFFGAWKQSHALMYIPVTYNAWCALAVIGRFLGGADAHNGLPPWPFHLGNIAIHLANVLLVFHILRRIGFRPYPALFGAMVFAIHPLQVEPVCWPTGMKDLLSSLLALTSVATYLHAAASWKSSDRTRGHVYYSLSLMALFLGTLAKPGIVGIPLIACALDVGFISGWHRGAAARAIGVVMVVVPSLVWTRAFQPAVDFDNLSLWLRPTVACHALGFYMGKVFLPSRLCIDYGLRPLVVVMQARHIVLGLLVPAYLLLLLLVPRYRKTLAISGLAFVAGVLPVLGLAPFIFQFYSTVADRYVYLSMLGVSIGAAFVAGLVPSRRGNLALLAILAGLFIISWRQVGVWKDNVTLMSQNIRVNPVPSAAYNNLGTSICPAPDLLALIRERSSSTTGPASVAMPRLTAELVATADDLFFRSLASRPQVPEPLKNMIWNHAGRGEWATALQLAELAYRLGPIVGWDPATTVIGPYELGWLYKQVGQRESAYRCFFAALHLKPGDREAMRMLAELDQSVDGPSSQPSLPREAAPSPW